MAKLSPKKETHLHRKMGFDNIKDVAAIIADPASAQLGQEAVQVSI